MARKMSRSGPCPRTQDGETAWRFTSEHRWRWPAWVRQGRLYSERKTPVNAAFVLSFAAFHNGNVFAPLDRCRDRKCHSSGKRTHFQPPKSRTPANVPTPPHAVASSPEGGRALVRRASVDREIRSERGLEGEPGARR